MNKGIREQNNIPKTATRLAVLCLPKLSENNAMGYCKTTFPRPMTMGNRKANSILTLGNLPTSAGNRLINDKSTVPSYPNNHRSNCKT